VTISVFELFKVGIGPSSSHTVGPMVAARRFVLELEAKGELQSVKAIRVDLYGSLAMTGEGHCTDRAILLGLMGKQPHSIDPDRFQSILLEVDSTASINLNGKFQVPFRRQAQLVFNRRKTLPQHPNGMVFIASGADNEVLLRECYFSIGGGFVFSEAELSQQTVPSLDPQIPYPFSSSVELLALGDLHGLGIAEMAMANEKALANELSCTNGEEITEKLFDIWLVMQECIRHGCDVQGVLPGKLGIQRRARDLHEELMAIMDWVDMFALAVNEENAAGCRVVTAPTNGAAGVIPAVLAYYLKFVHTSGKGSQKHAVVDFLLTAGAIAMLFKKNASISAAEVGCQGEIGVACSMAAAGLTAVMGGSNRQIENAAEIGMEHNLGLTCDPIGGLVQIPCIERNTMGAIKAINASRLALRGSGKHYVSLDQVIATMKQTGRDMRSKYKETSKGGLAVNVIAC
jgi:L-serine dehydratase